ncbi:hypothetical protein CK220_10535 [Mesorhizobium sp. WSM3860]|nr:hypothetical protein CK220_10535 [Mesorhizobium sp. WSM3860]
MHAFPTLVAEDNRLLRNAGRLSDGVLLWKNKTTADQGGGLEVVDAPGAMNVSKLRCTRP